MRWCVVSVFQVGLLGYLVVQYFGQYAEPQDKVIIRVICCCFPRKLNVHKTFRRLPLAVLFMTGCTCVQLVKLSVNNDIYSKPPLDFFKCGKSTPTTSNGDVNINRNFHPGPVKPFPNQV